MTQPVAFSTVARLARAAPDPAAMVRRYRVELGLSQNQLAIRARVDPAYINRIERRLGSHSPSRTVVLRLAAALELDLDQGDRLLHAFGLAGRIDWQVAFEQLAADLPAAVSAATHRAMADVLRQALATTEPTEPEP